MLDPLNHRTTLISYLHFVHFEIVKGLGASRGWKVGGGGCGRTKQKSNHQVQEVHCDWRLFIWTLSWFSRGWRLFPFKSQMLPKPRPWECREPVPTRVCNFISLSLSLCRPRQYYYLSWLIIIKILKPQTGTDWLQTYKLLTEDWRDLCCFTEFLNWRETKLELVTSSQS